MIEPNNPKTQVIEGDMEKWNELQVGHNLTIWLNHAYIAGSRFGRYVVVDSDLDDDPWENGNLRVVDAWVR
jgi:hypothetical protein